MVNKIDFDLPEPHSYGQYQILEALQTQTFTTLMCGRRYGKSTVSIIWLITACLKGEKCAYVTPDYDLAREFMDEIVLLLPHEIIEVNRTLFIVRFPHSGGVLKFQTGQNIDSIRGKKFSKIVVDEAQKIPDLKYAFESVLIFCVLDMRGQILFCGTPRGKDYFYTLCQRSNKDWKHFHRTTYDNPTLPPDMIKIIEDSVDSISEEMLAIAGENKDAIVSREVIERNTIAEYSKKPTVIIACDIAAKKDNTSILGADADGVMTFHQYFKNPDWLVTMEALKALPNDILKVLDYTGVGVLAYELLVNEYGKQNWLPFQFDSVSKPKVMQEFRHALLKDRLKFDSILANELSTFEVTLNPVTKNLKFEAMRSCHDDACCAMAMLNKHLEQGKTITVQDYMNRFSW